MTLQEWLNLFARQIAETDWMQWIAVTLGVAEVLFAKVNNIWLYPTGIVATLLSIFLLYKAGLFAEALLNVYYVVMSVYGWAFWINGKNEERLKITTCNLADWLITWIIVILGGIGLYFILARLTSSTVPLWDAWVSSTAWAGMWLLAKRKLENWLLLNLSNIFAIPLLFYKHLPLYAALTIFLFVIGCQGFIRWRRTFKMENRSNTLFNAV